MSVHVDAHTTHAPCTHNTCTQAHRHNTHTHTHAPLSSVTVVPLYTLLMPPSRNSCFAQSIELEYRAFPIESCWIWRAGGKETHMCYIPTSPPPPPLTHTCMRHLTLSAGVKRGTINAPPSMPAMECCLNLKGQRSQ